LAGADAVDRAAAGRESRTVEYPFLSGLGVAAPAGLNAYLPLLIVALADRFSNSINLDRPYDFLSSNVGLAILIFLVSVEVIVDKIPGVDHANDLIQSIIRPAAGAFLMMAVNSDGGSLNPVVAMLVGLLAAGGVHAAKATARPAVTVTTGGLGNPLVSVAEDGFAALMALSAILFPLLALLLLVVLLVAIVWSVRTARRLVGRAGKTSPQASANRGNPSPTLRR
jgi:hypothetical protein